MLLFSTQPQYCLTSWIELQMLLRSCVIYINIIILRHIFIFLSMPKPRLITAWKVSKYGLGLNTRRYRVSAQIHSEYRKIRTRKNSVFGHFSRSVCHIFVTYFVLILQLSVGNRVTVTTYIFNQQVPRNHWYSLCWPFKHEWWGSFPATLWFWTWDFWFGRPAP